MTFRERARVRGCVPLLLLPSMGIFPSERRMFSWGRARSLRPPDPDSSSLCNDARSIVWASLPLFPSLRFWLLLLDLLRNHIIAIGRYYILLLILRLNVVLPPLYYGYTTTIILLLPGTTNTTNTITTACSTATNNNVCSSSIYITGCITSTYI